MAAACIELPRIGRQWSMVFFSALMGVSMFIYTVVTTEAGSIGLNALEYIAQVSQKSLAHETRTVLTFSNHASLHSTASCTPTFPRSTQVLCVEQRAV